MPEKTMTVSQKEKLESAFRKFLGNVGEYLDREVAQYLIEKGIAPFWDIAHQCEHEYSQLKDVIEKAKTGECRVEIVVRGCRPMYSPNSGYGNGFCFPPFSGRFLVGDVCRLTGISPFLLDLIYFNFRFEEIYHPNWKELNPLVWRARMQIITDLLPFPAIEWREEDGLRRVEVLQKGRHALALENIKLRCRIGQAARRRWNREAGIEG